MKKILIVDDDPLFIETLIKILKKEYSIFASINPEEVMELLKKDLIDLLITDYRMPQMTGKELIIKVKTLYPQIKILMVTAYPKEYLQSQAIIDDLPVDNYIQKPVRKIDIDNLFSTNREICDILIGSENKALNDIPSNFDINYFYTEDDVNKFDEKDFYGLENWEVYKDERRKTAE